MSEAERRWEQGVPHDPRSVELAESIAKIDSENDDAFDFRFGGDGDNGEELLYLLDIHFAALAAPPASEAKREALETIRETARAAAKAWTETTPISRSPRFKAGANGAFRIAAAKLNTIADLADAALAAPPDVATLPDGTARPARGSG